MSHAATAYGAIGAWVYVEPSLSPLTKAMLSVLTEFGDLFALGTFMLVAGFLTPTSLVRKGSARFVGDRLLRLGAPVLLTVLVVTPLVVWMIVAATGYPLTLAAYVSYQLGWLDPVQMWFPAVLLIFTLCYAAWRRMRPASGSRSEALRMRHLIVAAVLIAGLTFVIRLGFPVGSQQPLELHLWQWPQLAVLFAVGVVARERGWLEASPSRLIRRVSWLAVVVTVPVLFAIVAVSGSDVTSGSGMSAYSGGWHWQAALAAGAEGVVSVAGTLTVIELFRRFATWSGRLPRTLGRDSYMAFFLQLPVLVALELALRPLAWPGEVKLGLTAPAAIAICFTTAWAIRRARGAAAGRPWRTTGSKPGPRRLLPHSHVG